MRPERGFALVAALFVMVVIGLAVAAMSRLSVTQTASVDLLLQQARAYQAARAGLESEESPQIYPSPCACRYTSSHSRRSVATSTCRGSAPACRLRYSRPTRHTDRTAFVLTVLDW